MAFDYRTEYQRYRKYFVDLRRLYQARKEVRAYMSLAFAIITSGFFMIFAIRPTVVTIASLFSEVRAQQDIDARLDKKAENLRKAYETYGAVKDRLSILEQSGPENPQIAAFLEQVEALAPDSGVSIKAFNFDNIDIYDKSAPIEGKASKKFQQAGFSVTVNGNYDQINRFITGIEGMRRVVILNTFTYGTSRGDASGENLTLSVTGGVVYRPFATTATESKKEESIPATKKESTDI